VPELSVSYHMDVAQQSPTCTLLAIVDPAPTTEAIAAKAGVPLYKSLDELMLHESIKSAAPRMRDVRAPFLAPVRVTSANWIVGFPVRSVSGRRCDAG
jgi:hypothetical protein